MRIARDLYDQMIEHARLMLAHHLASLFIPHVPAMACEVDLGVTAQDSIDISAGHRFV